MKDLNREDLISINGGHDGTSYNAGQVVGNVLEVVITVVGVGKVAKFLKKFW